MVPVVVSRCRVEKLPAVVRSPFDIQFTGRDRERLDNKIVEQEQKIC